MKILRVLAAVAVVGMLLAMGVLVYFEHIANPRVVKELIEQPDGERARRVMLLTLPSDRRIPVNYLREDDIVYAAADGTWWRELEAGDFSVTLLIRGETLKGQARAVLDDPNRVTQVFARLRPNAAEGFGTLIEIRLEAE